jgi:starch synthase (maltosyl-transferring)
MPSAIDASRRIVIENVRPQLDCERYAVKREVGDTLEVWAGIFREGHDAVAAAVRWRTEREEEWHEVRMQPLEIERWFALVRLTQNLRYYVTVVAWTDRYGTWAADTLKRYQAGQDVAGEIAEGLGLLAGALGRAEGDDRGRLETFVRAIENADGRDAQLAAALDPELYALVDRWAERPDLTGYERTIPVQVDREQARFAAWYELFPRSMSDDPERHGTFDDVIRKLPYVRDLGFDVLYLPPIHPIGRTARKGGNNSLYPEPGDPGSPYAIGGAEGGHMAVHPELGTLDDFRRLVDAARDHGLEVALDFAIQVSPDHPYVREHPGWFSVRPDGTIRCAENPPKRYEDIYPLHFYGEDWEAQWEEWRDVLLFWVGQGVKTFRVDNPHTKPVQFWEWAIREVQRDHPEVIFLSEVFARPSMMRVMSKAGFTQSYTYFTWRNTRAELAEYLEELTQGEMKEYFRGNLFTNTPDILSEFLQRGGPPAFRIRAVLAATLSSAYGIYSGFELCENAAHPGRKEEYLNSEKYEIRAWDWNRPGNIRPLIARLNRIRRENPALQEYDNLRFYECDDDHVLFYGKATPDRRNLVFVAVSVDPFEPREATLSFPLDAMSVAPYDCWEAVELLTDERHLWRGSAQRVRLDPEQPARIFSVAAWRPPEGGAGYQYAVDPVVSETVRRELARHFHRLDPPRARQFMEASRGSRLITEYDGIVRPYALRSGNVGDALTALWIMSWTVVQGIDYPPPEHVRAVRAQVAEAGFPDPAPSEMQKLTEGLIYQFMFLHADYEEARAARDAARIGELAAVARQTAGKLGFAVDGVRLTEAGFSPV